MLNVPPGNKELGGTETCGYCGERKDASLFAVQPLNKTEDIGWKWRDQVMYNMIGTNPVGTNTQNFSTSWGGSQNHENRPPFYALAFIMKK